MGGLLIFLGIVGMLLGLWGVIRGRVAWMRIASRGAAGLVILGGLVVTIVGGAISPSGKQGIQAGEAAAKVTAPIASSTAAAKKPIPAASSTAAPKAAVSHIGDTVNIQPWQYKVTAVSTAASVGDTADGFGDTANGEYVIVTVAVGDAGSEAGTLEADMMQLVDAQGHTYSYDISATTDVNPVGKDLFFQTVNPGVTDTAQIAYDVPKSLDPATLSMAVTNGIIATKTAYIALHK